MVPDRSLFTIQLSGVKKEKERITIHHCCNASGSHKLPMWIIGKYKRPRCFKAAGVPDPEVLGIKWRANKKAWMITSVMVDWMLWFDRQMAGRKVVLLMDNFSAHTAALNDITSRPHGYGSMNTEVVLLPPNSTSKLQPLDQGVMASFKARYRRHWVTFMLEQHQLGYDSVNTMNILKAIRFSVKAWNEVTSITIANCWRHSGLNIASQSSSNEVLIEAVDDLQASLQLLSNQTRIQELMSVDYLLHLPEEAVVDHEGDVPQQLVEQQTPEDDYDPEEQGIEEIPPISSQRALNLLRQLRTYEEQSKECNPVWLQSLDTWESLIRRRHMDAIRQSGIQTFFPTIE